MIPRILPLILLFCLCLESSAQYKQGPFNTKRKKVAVQNFTLYLHLHDLAIEYSSKIEQKTDSLLKSPGATFHQGLFDFRIRSLQSLEHVLFRSDAVIAYLDSWVFAAQINQYMKTQEARDLLGFGHATMAKVFQEFEQEFPPTYEVLTGEDPSVLSARVAQFSMENPIVDNHLNRTSIIDDTAKWVGEDTIGLTRGLSTLTDLLRNFSDRLNYHAEFTPKLIEWNVESSIGNVLGMDSVGPVLVRSVTSLERITNTIDSIDHLVYSIMDTVLTDIDRQRWATLKFISSERIAIMEQLSLERQAILDGVTQEREAIERLIHQERQASFDQLEAIVTNTTYYSFDRVDGLVNRIFFKVLVLVGIIAVGIVLAAILFKKL